MQKGGRMKTYNITLPITGIIYKTVEAESEEKAIALAIDESTIDDIEEWEIHLKIVSGNVFYGIQNEMEIEVEDDGEDSE